MDGRQYVNVGGGKENEEGTTGAGEEGLGTEGVSSLKEDKGGNQGEGCRDRVEIIDGMLLEAALGQGRS